MAKVSPVAASAAYLEHLRDAWNARVAGKTADDRLENQDVLLTVPASFDAVARELTVEAAGQGRAQAGHAPRRAPGRLLRLARASRATQWRKQVKVGDIILVCDVGGGTTDFTLIAVSDEGGDLVLTRLAVGEHILLGGDNMDLALAYAVAATLPQGMEGLDAAQRVALGYACRTAKETLFAEPKKSAGPGDRPRPRLEGHRRLDQDRADARAAQRRRCSTASCPAAPDRPARCAAGASA